MNILDTIIDKFRPDVDTQGVPRGGEFLPDFCRGSIVINVVILAEFLALVGTVLTERLLATVFHDFLMVSVFVQWIALTSVAILCLLRPRINRLPPNRAFLTAYLILVCVAWGISELMLWVLWAAGFLESPRPPWYGQFHIRNLIVSSVVSAFALRYFLARHQLRQTTLSEASARRDVLKHRIRPHFLFNSLNIIAGLMHRAPARAGAAIEDVADLFRLMLDESKDLVGLNNEIAVAKKYLKLEKLRLEKRLTVNWDVGPVPRTAKTPTLILQLLLENAIHYGVEPFSEGGEVGIKIQAVDDNLYINVDNRSADIELDDASQADNTAMEYIRMRLNDYYRAAAKVIVATRNGRFEVSIFHPLHGASE